MLEQVAFFVVAAAMLASAARAVTSKNLVHTVLWLALTLAGTAVAYILLDAHFLAAIQVILYTGGVLTMMLFGVMLTRRDAGLATVPNPQHRLVPGLLLAGAVFAMVAGAVMRSPLPAAAPQGSNVPALGHAIFTEHVLAFEVLSLLLLGAVLGAIVLARKRDAGDEAEARGPAVPARRKLDVGGTT